MVGLGEEEPFARRRIAEEKAVDDHEAKRAAKPKPKERPTHAAEREEKREANNRENHAETDARATRERKRKPRREREDAPSQGRWTGEGQKEEANRHDKPFFICGDWNDKPTDPFIKEMKKQGFLILNNITESANNYTFPARNQNCIIAYIASYGKRYKSIMSRNVIADTQASDHRPVLVAIRLQSYATGLGEVKNENQTNVIYDLQGREVASAKMRSDKCLKGIYIQAGHKRLMK